MKILKVTFENINSLKGRHQIDFTHPDYAANNIFAITGPTGSGKSTILDAICLALYGKTPRQNMISKTTNEIMSKGTGECFSELEFAVDDIRYLCRWSQIRARGKQDGNLQAPRHEVSQLTDDKPEGDIIASGITKVKDCVEEITNLDFDRFTRSILLAQGEFDTFLNANSSQKGEILEQITGTQVYGEISKAVYEESSERKKALDLAKVRLEGITFLDAEQRENIEAELEAYKQEADKLNEERQILREIQAKKQKVIDLQGQLDSLKQAQTELEKKVSDFAPRKRAYESAEKARNFKGEYDLLQRDNQAQEKLFQKIRAGQDEQQLIQERLDKAEKDYQEASAKLKDAEGKDHSMKESFNAARELDIKIENKAEAYAKSLKELKDQTDQNKELQETIAKLEKEIKKFEENKADKLRYKEEHVADAALVDSLKALVSMMDRLQEEQAKLRQLQDELKQLDCEALEKELQKLEKGSNKLKEGLNANDKELKLLDEDINKLLGGKSREGIQDESERLSQEIKDLSPLLEHLKQKENKLQQRQKLQSELESAAKTLLNLKAEVKTLEPQVSRMQEELVQQKLIRSLDDHRKELQENQPCPLCGSTHHPYIQDLPAIKEDNLSSLQEALQQQQKELETKRESITKTQTESDLKQQSLSELIDELNKLDESIIKLRPETDQALESETIKAELDQKEEAQKGLQKLIKELDQLQSQKDKKAAQRDKLMGEIIEQNKELSRTNIEFTALTNEKRGLMKQIGSQKTTIEQQRDGLNQQLQPFSLQITADTLTQELKETLTASKKAWLANEENLRMVKEELIIREKEHANKTESLKEQQDKLATSEKQTKSLEQEKAELKKQRTQVLDAIDVEKAEQKWNTELVKRRREESEGKQTLEKSKSELQNSQKQLEHMQKEHSQQAQELQAANDQFQSRIQAQGFDDLPGFTQALLGDAEFAQLKGDIEQLTEEKQRLEGILEQTTKDIKQAQAQDQDPREMITIKEVLAELENRLSEASRKQGECDSKLKMDKDQHMRFATQEKEISELEQQYKPWERLNHLIGSAGGKKFRTFAQGITFDLLIHYANKHLSKLNHRYQLKHRQDIPLELDVIDLFQADQVRSINNLSGGESFLVSLALALGLSSMSSQNIKIGSLFLDEGFGSLDEDSLELAISTLSELKRDEEKLIGVISHVPAIRERITCQITVTSMPGGVSKLEGPGVN